MLDSDALNISSNPSKWTAENSIPSKTWPTTLSKNAMLTSEETCIKTSYCLVVLLCLRELVRDSWRKLSWELPSLFKSKSLQALTGSLLCGEEDLLLLLYLHLQACGLLRKIMMNMELLLYTENAFEWSKIYLMNINSEEKVASKYYEPFLVIKRDFWGIETCKLICSSTFSPVLLVVEKLFALMFKVI